MAPEQVEGRWRDYGPWTDLYALGCVAWHLAAGRPPFVHTKAWRVAKAHLDTPLPHFEPRHPLPDEFDGWLARLLAKDPTRRFHRAAEAAHALLRLQDPAPAKAFRGKASEVSPRPELSSLEPLAFDQLDTVSLPEPTAPPAEPEPAAAIAIERPPMPAPWRRQVAVPDPKLLGAGLGLFHHRTIPFVGREEERELLWYRLTQVHTEGLAHLANHLRPTGIGRTRLARWIAERAHETGAASFLTATHDPSSGPRHGLPGALARLLRSFGLLLDESR